jgi:hypothetical protein
MKFLIKLYKRVYSFFDSFISGAIPLLEKLILLLKPLIIKLPSVFLSFLVKCLIWLMPTSLIFVTARLILNKVKLIEITKIDATLITWLLAALLSYIIVKLKSRKVRRN